jgi:hypothetical protein
MRGAERRPRYVTSNGCQPMGWRIGCGGAEWRSTMKGGSVSQDEFHLDQGPYTTENNAAG